MLITCVLVRGTTCENWVRVINTRTDQQARHCAKHQDVHSMLRHTHDTNDPDRVTHQQTSQKRKFRCPNACGSHRHPRALASASQHA